MQKYGYKFVTETDSEVIPHLIDSFIKKGFDLFDAVRASLNELEGTYGLAIVYSKEPDKLIVARKGSPLVLGIGDGENFVASDVSAIIAHTKQVVYLEDGEVVEITRDNFITKDLALDDEIEKEVHEISMTIDELDKGGYPHFMLKEIMEQPESVQEFFKRKAFI